MGIIKYFLGIVLAVLTGVGSLFAPPIDMAPGAAIISEQEAYEIGIEAYQYMYPLILMDITRRVMTNYEPGEKPGMGPMNSFHHMRSFPASEFREVARPNFDTLYSSAWLDLTEEPVIMSVPDTDGRYYILTMLDMWSDVFAAPGKRTSGTGAASFAVVKQGWRGKLPEGVERIESPTPYVWIIGRTQTNGAEDYEAVNKMQDGYTITPVSRCGDKPRHEKVAIDPNVDMRTPPLMQVNAMSAEDYFCCGAELMRRNPPHITDWSMVTRLKRIGIEPGYGFDLDRASSVVRAALERAVVDGPKSMKDKAPTIARVIKGWQMNTDTMGVYGNDYLKRAIVAMIGLGANQPVDAIYLINVADAEWKPMNGANKYVLHFDNEELPPAEAFWSLTMYDADGFHVTNEFDRFDISDRDDLKYNADGSLDLYIQHENPGPDKEVNWLPSPKGAISVTMRLYAPKPQALDGRWAPPEIKRIVQ